MGNKVVFRWNGSPMNPYRGACTLKQVSIVLYSNRQLHSIEGIRIRRDQRWEASKRNANIHPLVGLMKKLHYY